MFIVTTGRWPYGSSFGLLDLGVNDIVFGALSREHLGGRSLTVHPDISLRSHLQPPWATKRAYLGISLGRLYYSSPRLRSYCAWAMANSPRGFAFLIGDDIYAFTLRAFAGLSTRTALSRAQAKGNDIHRQLARIVDGREPSPSILRWSDLQKYDLYWSLLNAALHLRDSQPAFQTRLRMQALTNLRKRFDDSTGWSLVREARIWRNLEAYVVHEIAGLITMSERAGYPVEVYPGPDLEILREIYRGTWPELHALLPSEPERDFYELRLD